MYTSESLPKVLAHIEAAAKSLDSARARLESAAALCEDTDRGTARDLHRIAVEVGDASTILALDEIRAYLASRAERAPALQAGG